MKKTLLTLALVVTGTIAVAQTSRVVPINSGAPTGDTVPVGAPTISGGSTKPGVDISSAKKNSMQFAPLPNLDNGPGDLVPTELLMRRTITADFNGQYNQEANVYLPVYYHAGFLNLDGQGKQELQAIEREFAAFIKEYELFLSRFGDFVNRYQSLHERGRPRGVIQYSQLLIPYSGSDSKVKDGLDPLRIIKLPKESANSGTVEATTSNATPVKAK